MTLAALRMARCGVCGIEAPFGADWRWPTFPADWEYYDARVLNPVCSDRCEAALLGKAAC